MLNGSWSIYKGISVTFIARFAEPGDLLHVFADREMQLGNEKVSGAIKTAVSWNSAKMIALHRVFL